MVVDASWVKSTALHVGVMLFGHGGTANKHVLCLSSAHLIRFSFQAPPRVASEWLRRLRVKRVEAGIGVVECDLFPRAPLVKSTLCVCKA